MEGATQGQSPQQQSPQQQSPQQLPPQAPSQQPQEQPQQPPQPQQLGDLLLHELWAVIFRLTDAKTRSNLFRVSREARAILMGSTERLQITYALDQDARQLATQLLSALSLPGGSALKLSSLCLAAPLVVAPYSGSTGPALSTFLQQLGQDARSSKLAGVRQLEIICDSVSLYWHTLSLSLTHSLTHTHTHSHTHTHTHSAQCTHTCMMLSWLMLSLHAALSYCVALHVDCGRMWIAYALHVSNVNEPHCMACLV